LLSRANTGMNQGEKDKFIWVRNFGIWKGSLGTSQPKGQYLVFYGFSH